MFGVREYENGSETSILNEYVIKKLKLNGKKIENHSTLLCIFC